MVQKIIYYSAPSHQKRIQNLYLAEFAHSHINQDRRFYGTHYGAMGEAARRVLKEISRRGKRMPVVRLQ